MFYNKKMHLRDIAKHKKQYRLRQLMDASTGKIVQELLSYIFFDYFCLRMSNNKVIIVKRKKTIYYFI